MTSGYEHDCEWQATRGGRASVESLTWPGLRRYELCGWVWMYLYSGMV